MGLGVALVIASLPELLITACRVSNEGLAIAFGSLVVVLALRLGASTPGAARGALFGLVLGLAMLTKAYFLVLPPYAAVLLLWIWYARRSERRTAACQALAALALCLAVCALWYGRTLVLTGTITGQLDEVAAHASSGPGLASAIRTLRWLRVLDMVALTYIWLGNWSFLVVRRWMYLAIELIFALSLCGLVWLVISPRPSLPRRKDLLVLALPGFALLLGLSYHAVAGFLSSGQAGTMGYYLYCFVAPEIILLTAGLARLLPPKWALLPAPFLVFAFLGLELFGTLCLLLPYYGGMIEHRVSGSLPAFHLSQLAGDGWRTLFEHLLANKPEAFGLSGLIALTVLFVCSSASLLWISAVLAREKIVHEPERPRFPRDSPSA